MALGVGLFVEEPGGFGFSGGSQRGPTGRPALLTPVSRARVVELLEEGAGGLTIKRMRALLCRGRRTAVATEEHARLAGAVSAIRSSRRVRVDHLAEVLGCDPATIWRLTQRGRSQLQDPGDPYVGSSAPMAA